MTDNDQAAAAAETPREFAIQRIYIKDLSFEAPNVPQIFNSEWKPESNLNLNSESKQVGEDSYEVILSVTVTTKVDGKVAFLVEAQQAGIFRLVGFPEKEKGHMLGSYCPNTLFPYLREVITDLVTKGSFPQLVLTPVNFDALYAQHLAEKTAKEQADSSPTTH
ncbi:MAG: protein-export chaperone SecB [Candidatus Polarisedimenticolaceae bacterium]|nr:protein-export chaperone SecB [Candidatus Polarisedimenticolaceae bacterium]